MPFPSAGEGFARGFASTYIPRKQMAVQQQQIDAQAQAARSKALRDSLDGLKEDTFNTLKEISSAARDLAQSGNASENDFNSFIQAGQASIAATGSYYQQLIAQTVAAGGDPSAIQAELDSFITQTRELVPAAIEAGRMMAPHPQLEGQRSGEQVKAELRSALGREPTEIEIQRKMGVAPREPLVSITGPGEETEFGKKLGQMEAEQIAEIMQSGRNVGVQIAQLDRIETALDSGGFTPGSFGFFRSNLANFADFIGAGPAVKAMVGDAAIADTMDAAANQLAIDLAEKMSRVTNMSLTFIRDSLPGLLRTEEGNRIIIDFMRRTAQRERTVADIADEYAAKGTLRPPGEPSFYDRISALDQSDPIVDEDLRKRIMDGSRQAPSSFLQLFGSQEPEGIPDGARKIGILQGSDGLPIMENGQFVVIYQLPDGSRVKWVAEPRDAP